MIDQCAWLPACVSQFDATNVMAETDMLEAIKNYGAIKQASTDSQSQPSIDDTELTL